jgi:hypothetical protein
LSISFKTVIFTGGGKIGNCMRGAGAPFLYVKKPETESALPSPGFYPEISGFFEVVGIFLGFLF